MSVARLEDTKPRVIGLPFGLDLREGEEEPNHDTAK